MQLYLEELFSTVAPTATLRIHGTHRTFWLASYDSIGAPDFAITLGLHCIRNMKNAPKPLLAKLVIGVGEAKKRGTNIEGDDPLGLYEINGILRDTSRNEHHPMGS